MVYLFTIHKPMNLKSTILKTIRFGIMRNYLGCIQLKNGNYAINSQPMEQFIFNPKTSSINLINSSIGLQDDYVIAQYEDKTGNLWLALNYGLSKVYLTFIYTKLYIHAKGNV
jgi:hypothetical protein